MSKISAEFVPLAIIFCGLYVETSSYECNRTIVINPGHDQSSEKTKLTFNLSDSALVVDYDKPFYCFWNIESRHGYFVEINVKDVRAGDFDNKTMQCSGGYLRISENSTCSTDPEWLPSTTLCAPFKKGNKVKRVIQSSSAFVEFKLDQAKGSKGYEFDATFLDKVEEEKPIFGDVREKSGRIKNTKCDLLIAVDNCIGYCTLVSPGYPGIYPPSTICRYLLTNFDDGRVEVIFGGRNSIGDFALMQSPNCSKDYVDIYDGTSTIHPKIGRYCGKTSTHLISSGSSMYIVFETGPGGPPWDYRGFKLQITNRWKLDHKGGYRRPGTTCDWIFDSRKSLMGDAHNPDHKLEENTECSFEFAGDNNHRVEIHLAIYMNRFRPNCEEYFVVYDGDNEVEKICQNKTSARLSNSKTDFYFNTTKPFGKVVYHRTSSQHSNNDLSWIYYRFWTDPDIPYEPLKRKMDFVMESAWMPPRKGQVVDSPANRLKSSLSLDALGLAHLLVVVLPWMIFNTE